MEDKRKIYEGHFNVPPVEMTFQEWLGEYQSAGFVESGFATRYWVDGYPASWAQYQWGLSKEKRRWDYNHRKGTK